MTCKCLSQAPLSYLISVSDNVVFDIFQKPSIRKRTAGHKGHCRAQIWQYKPLTRVAPGLQDERSSPISIVSRRRSTAVASTLADTISSHSTASVISGADCDGLSIQMPKPPVLVLYTKYKEKYSFLQIHRMIGNIPVDLFDYFLSCV